MGENIFEPKAYISMNIPLIRGGYIFIEIIYFRANSPNEPVTVAFLTCDGFSHWVFPHEGFDAPVSLCAQCNSLQLGATARRGVLGGDPCAPI